MANDGPRRPSLRIPDAKVTEGDTGATHISFSVNLSPAADEPISIDYTVTAGTAEPNSDFVPKSGTTIFLPGQTRQLLDVAVINDNSVEEDETILVTLSNAVNARLTNTSAIGMIIDNDALPPDETGTSVEISIEGDPWETGFNGYIRLTNNSGNIIDDFTLEFTADWAIGSLWNGNYLGRNGSSHIITAPDWFGFHLPDGASLQIGFLGVGSFSRATGILLIGPPPDMEPMTFAQWREKIIFRLLNYLSLQTVTISPIFPSSHSVQTYTFLILPLEYIRRPR